MADADLTAERLREFLLYDEATGIFTRKIQTRGLPVGAVAGRPDRKGHVCISVKGIKFFAHRLAWLYVHGVWPVDQLDHLNGVKHDNRIANLRDVDTKVNSQNRRTSINALGLLGVCKQKNRFKASLWVDGRSLHLGLYKTPEQAHQAYLVAKRQHHPGCQI